MCTDTVKTVNTHLQCYVKSMSVLTKKGPKGELDSLEL